MCAGTSRAPIQVSPQWKNQPHEIHEIYPVSLASPRRPAQLSELSRARAGGWLDKGPKVDRTPSRYEDVRLPGVWGRILEPDYILVSVVPGEFSCSFHPMTKLRRCPRRQFSLDRGPISPISIWKTSVPRLPRRLACASFDPRDKGWGWERPFVGVVASGGRNSCSFLLFHPDD